MQLDFADGDGTPHYLLPFDVLTGLLMTLPRMSPTVVSGGLRPEPPVSRGSSLCRKAISTAHRVYAIVIII